MENSTPYPGDILRTKTGLDLRFSRSLRQCFTPLLSNLKVKYQVKKDDEKWPKTITLPGMVTGTGRNWKVPIKTLIIMLIVHSLSMIMITDHD